MKVPSVQWVVMAALPLLAFSPQDSATNPILIRNVTIIDGTGRVPPHGMSVVISNGRITTIGLNVKSPPNPIVLDGTGKYLIPGLWNMHAHLGAYADASRALSNYLAQGVTGIRDMGSPLDDILRLRRDTDDGTILAPHLVVAGPIVQGPLP